jgi:acyl-CoA synthetase (AMP-forming)/AMP-acid ligase II
VFASLRVAGERPPDLPEDPDRDVAIIFTSGTTGIPKGARYGNRQLTAITTNDVSDTWGGGGRSYTGVSFSTLGFMTKLPSNLRRGGLSLITNKWRASEALRLSAEFKLTVVGGVPTQVALMLRDPDFDSYDLSSVQYIVLGGGPVTPGLAEEARRRFHAKLSTRYACTESGIGLGTGFDDPEEDAIVSVGRPHPGVELQVVDANDDPLPVGEIGEVALRSDAIMSGYWNDPEQTAAAFTRDGFVRTGDLGYVDDRGRLRLVGRNKEMYVRGGYNVYPVEIEGLLSTHPAIAAVAIVPRPDSVMGEIGVAVIVVREGEAPPTLAEVRAHIEPDLARYKLPEAVRYAATLPLTPAEKLDRRALADIVRSDVEPDVR